MHRDAAVVTVRCAYFSWQSGCYVALVASGVWRIFRKFYYVTGNFFGALSARDKRKSYNFGIFLAPEVTFKRNSRNLSLKCERLENNASQYEIILRICKMICQNFTFGQARIYLMPRAPYFGGAQNFGSKDKFPAFL